MPPSSFNPNYDDSPSNGNRDSDDDQSKPPDSTRNAHIPAQLASKHRNRKRKVAGFKAAHSRVERGTDAFDYEQKFSEDEPFKEMGPMARVWKTFLAEYAKFDADRVEDWRDALDVLLVFAGLFSAVVSTFLTQTSQSLQVDYSQVSAYMMYEMLHLQRAMMDGLPASSVVSSNITPTSPVRPSRTDAWVNVLWYTSLALSLTTALMAVLTKQWIHQYMAVPSGTPRDRSRIRQFRFECIEKWHVPLIIGLLPVLMHVALGVFFFGLVLHVRSLSTPGATLVSVIAFIAFIAYFGTTLLPILKPDCPYKTYLTLYSYSISAHLCMMSRRNHLRLWITRHLRVIRWFFPGQSNVPQDTASVEAPPWPKSLRDVEKLAVESMSDALEARALIGLYNISSNTSVQSIVLQAMSALPLELFSAIKAGIPDVAQRICMLVESMEYTAPEKQTAYERLYRVHVRIEPPIPEYGFVPPNVLTPSLTRAVRGPNTLSLLVSRKSPEHAIAFLRHHISLRSGSCQRFDVLVWARILQNALSTGADWLDVGDNNSPVWSTVLPWLEQSHGCSEITICDPICVDLVSLPLVIDGRHPEFGALDPDSFRLNVRTSPEFPSAYPIEIRWVFTMLLRPSIVEYLLLVLFPDTCSGDDYDGLPADILFNLALVQTRHVLLNSKTGSSDEDEDESQPIPRPQDSAVIVTHETPVARLLFFIREYVGLIHERCNVEGGTLGQHSPSILRASYIALNAVIASEAFHDGTLVSRDRRKILHTLVRIFNLNSDLYRQFCSGTTPSLEHELQAVAFKDFPRICGVVELVTEILDLSRGVEPYGACHSLWIETYPELARRGWLDDFLLEILGISQHASPEDTTGMRPMIYSFLAAAYVEGLAALKVSAPSVFQDTMDYLATSNNLVVLCLILALADDDRRRRSLQVLSAFLTADRWAACLSELQDFLAKDNAPRVWYNRYKKDFDLETLYIVYGGPPETLRFSVFEDVLLDYVAPAKRSVSAPESSQQSATYDSTAVASPATNNRWVRPLRRLLAMRGGDNMELDQRHSNSSQHSDGIV